MIKSVADLLQGFMKEETDKLNVYQLKHGPTIGAMYEGLSVKLLNRAIPTQLNLKIVDGFITDGKDSLSGQMDCMLVRGEGEEIPYTTSFKWHVKDVLVVFEVKKNLYSKDLINSFYKLRQVSESYSKYLFNGEDKDNNAINLSPSYKAFSQITGITAPNYHERETLSKENELIYTTLIMEQLMPVKIVLGYDGFSSEYGLRKGLIDFLESEGKGHGYGVPAFPQLIMCGKYSLVKGNGRPYILPMRSEYWDFMLSSEANPVLLMLEFVWTKLSIEFDIVMPWGDDLEMEGLNEFLRAKPVVNDKQGGWILKYDKLSKATLEYRDSTFDWEPIDVTSGIYVIFNQLAQEDVDTTEPDFISFAKKELGTVEKFINSIVATNHVSFDGTHLSLITDNLMAAIVPGGRFVVAGNNSRKFEAWLKSNF